MSGCRPEYMPLLVAAAKCMISANFKTNNMESTHSWIPYAIVNGPVARQLGIESGQGLITGSANMAIGHAIELMVRNICGLRIQETRMGSLGYTLPFVLAEDEVYLKKVKWDPYHVTKGMTKNQNAVSMGTSTTWGQNVIPATSDPRLVMLLIAREMCHKGVFASGTTNGSRLVMVCNPVADVLVAGGYTKATLMTDLIKYARVPTYDYSWSQVYGSYGTAYPSFEAQLQKNMSASTAQKGLLPEWWGKFTGSEEVVTQPVVNTSPSNYVSNVVVCGDPYRNKVQFLTGCGNYNPQEVQLPAKWDAMVAELGYKPLKDFSL
jgi:hypothetical protein